MLSPIIYTLISIFIISLISLIGVFTLSIKKEFLNKILILFVSFSVGALLGDSFIHLLPEAYETLSSVQAAVFLLLGILIFFILEKYIHWTHCHEQTSKTHPHTFAYINLVGDGLHNFIDGMIIASSFLVSIPLGIATSLAVILHEIPQEIGDFGILIYSGIKPKKAMFYNFVSSLFAFIGAFIVFFIGNLISSFSKILIPITAGGFLYLALSDLTPELHKHTEIKHSLMQIISILLGIGIMFLLLLIE